MALLALGACDQYIQEDYQRPDLPEKENWSELEGRELGPDDVIPMDWWAAFGDPYLNQLINTALADGPDLRLAFLRLEKAGITLRRERFPLTPDVTGGPVGSYTRSKADDNNDDIDSDFETFKVSLSWEIDIWGKVRKGVESATATYKSSEMDYRGIYLTLVTSVSDLYFQIRQFDEQIEQQEAAVAQSQELLRIWELQYQEGLVPQTNILSQKSEISARKLQLIELERSRKEAELRLATLLGKPAGTLSVPEAPLIGTVTLIQEPNILPGELLSRRPDILQAEYNLLAQYNLLGQTRLERLPSLSLQASAGTGAGFSTLLNTWNYAFLLDWTSFLDRNKKIAVEENAAEVNVLSETYRKTVLGAYEEVEIALLNLHSRHEQLKELETQVAALAVVDSVQKAQLKEGLVSQLEVFDTERNLLDAQQSILSNYRSMLSDTLVLYRAVGGGWPTETVANKNL